VTVKVLDPADTFLFVLIVSVVVPDPVTDDVLNLELANRGRPDTVNVTGLLNPGWPVMVTVKLVLSPRLISALAGLTEIEKSALGTVGAVTTRVVVVVRVKTPVSPVIVRV